MELKRIFETRTQAKVYRDVPFDLETPRFFRTTDVLPDLDVRALARFDGATWAGTATGLVKLDAAGARFERVDASTEAVLELVATSAALVVTRPGAIDVWTGGVPVRTTFTATTAALRAATRSEAGVVYAATDAGLYALGGMPERLTTSPARAVLAHGGTLFVATPEGVLRVDAESGAPLAPWTAPDVLPDDDVRALAISADGATLFAATATGFAKIPVAGGASTIVVAGEGGLPNGELLAIAEAGGAVITGHAIGATVLAGAKKDHYTSLRWVLDPKVNDVAIDADGTRWLATSAGLTRITLEPTTLTAKAELHEAMLPRYWRMDGFVDDVIEYDDAWDQTGAPRTDDNDNDGLWTQMQIGTWCLAYAVTGDEEHYVRARKAMDVMMMLFDVPAKTFTTAGKSPGFITRSLVRDDEGAVFDDKTTRANWHREEYEGRTYYWKDDTSSDEYAGHYFGIPLFYDLCAKTDAEKEALRERLRASTDYLIANDYLLIDLDGAPTTHGHWRDLGAAADGLDLCTSRYGFDIATCIDSYHGGGWLNSLEILGHLLATWHLTGDQKYYDEYERLYTVERYGKMIPIHEDLFTVTSPRFANHSDHELAMLAYYTLLRYEPNEDRRAILVKSIRDFYEYEREEHNPWQVATIASAFGEDVDLDGAVQTLKDMPNDWRTVRYDNSHRVDARRDVNDRFDRPQFRSVFPYDEIRTMKWNSSPYAVVDGGDPRSVLVPTSYLIAYWMARYHGLVEAP
ncbi:hypothetical protein L6R52_04130 [Myxococcota bacterium]|nr:hypothetical protein [Myxococcota bacterium]